MSLQGHNLNKPRWAGVPKATYQVTCNSAHRFRRIIFLTGFYHIGAWWPPVSCHQIFISFYLKAFIQSLVQICSVVSEKIQFKFLYVHHLGPRSRNSLNLQYSHIFIYSIRCLLLLTFRSLAAIVSGKSTVFTFSYRKA